MNTLRHLLVRPKGKILKERVLEPVYHIPGDLCDTSYIGEIERSLNHGFWSLEDPAPPSKKCHDIYINRQSRTSGGHGWS